MDFNSILSLDVRPAAFELFLHVTPDCPWLVVQLVHLDLGRLLQLIKTEFSLNNRGFNHKEFQLWEGGESLVSTPGCLNLNGSQDRAIWSLVLVAGIFDSLIDLNFIGAAWEDIFLWVPFKVEVWKLKKTQDIDIDIADGELGQETLTLLHQLRDDTPLGYILSLKLGILWGLIVKLSTFHDQLWISSHVLSFSLLALILLEIIRFVLAHALLLELERLIGFGKEIIIIVSFRHKSIFVIVFNGSFQTINELISWWTSLFSHALTLWQAHLHSPLVLVTGIVVLIADSVEMLGDVCSTAHLRKEGSINVRLWHQLPHWLNLLGWTRRWNRLRKLRRSRWCLLVNRSSIKGKWRTVTFESWRKIDVARDNSSIKEWKHAIRDVIFSDRRWVSEWVIPKLFW